MHEHQPQLPFGEQNTLEEIRKLLETQNELLRTLVDRIGDSFANPWAAPVDPSEKELFDEDIVDDLFDDDEFWDEAYEEETEDDLPDPPVWFAQHYPWE